MKILKTFAFFSVFCLSTMTLSLQAQIDVTVNPIGLLFGDLSVGADFILAENMSVEGTIGIGTGKDDNINFKHFNLPITGFFKYYFNPKNGADKFYADVFLRFVNRSYTFDGDGTSSFAEYSQTRFGGGFGIGYKVAADNGIIFDIGFGAGRAFVDNTSYKDEGTQTEIDWPDIMFAGKLGIGYRFGNK